MATATFSTEGAKMSILEFGFYHILESEQRGDAKGMDRDDFALSSNYGLDFCKQMVLDDTRIRSVLQTIFGWSGLGLYLRYRRDPGHIFTFRKGGPKAGLRVLIVQVWSKGSLASFYSGSHLHSLPTVRAANDLFEIPSAALRRVGCEAQEIPFPDGGLVITDARLAFEIKQGSVTTFAFTTKDELSTWVKMELPQAPGLADKVAAMESENIGVNFTFEE